jgi:Protein of unknown function (DUF3168)
MIFWWLNNLGMGGGGAPYVALRARIAAKLNASQALAALVGPNVYPAPPPQSWREKLGGACLTYQVINREFGQTLDGYDGTSQALVQLSAWSLTESIALAVAAVLKAEWLGHPVEFDEVSWEGRDVRDVPAGDGTDRIVYMVTTDFQINHRTDGA